MSTRRCSTPTRDTGPVFIHGISNNDVRMPYAPRDPRLNRLPAWKVASSLPITPRSKSDSSPPSSRAPTSPLATACLVSLWLGQRTFDTPNHKLATLARHAGIAMPDAHAALGDVRAVAQLLPLMLPRHPEALGYPCSTMGRTGHYPRSRQARPGPAPALQELRRGTDGWMASILARLPMSAAEAGYADAERYLSALSSALEDGRIVGDEARALAQLAGAAGFGSSQVAALEPAIPRVRAAGCLRRRHPHHQRARRPPHRGAGLRHTGLLRRP